VNILWYLVGALLHVLWRWSGWKSNNREQGWLAYWKYHLAANVQAMIGAVLCMFIWTQDLIYALVQTTGVGVDLPHIERTALSSLTAGFVLELIVARFAVKFGFKGK
jgi:hypothetical protein